MLKTLTVFTPAYNRAHTIGRTYESLCRQTCKDLEWLIIDDGSSDNTRLWLMSLSKEIKFKDERFDWMGRLICSSSDKYDHFIIDAKGLHIEYIYKPNGGLYTGYNTAYALIETELNMCIDSDDYVPDDAIESVIRLWRKHYPIGFANGHKSIINNKEYCGILGLDFDIHTRSMIGGFFPKRLEDCNMLDLESRKLHTGDTKQVMRTDLMKKVSPMEGFEGEKNFNPFYMLMQVCDLYPMIIFNNALCIVDYQIGADSMSQGIYKQYINSPRSYAKYRAKTMQLNNITWKRKIVLAIHYISSCIIAKDKHWLKNSPYPLLTLFLSPLGFFLYSFIVKKVRQ